MTSSTAVSILVPTARNGDRRVGATPETVGSLHEAGFAITVETGAGNGAFFSDEEYRRQGAEIVDRANWTDHDVVLSVSPWCDPPPSPGDGTVVLGFLDPYRHATDLEAWAAAGVSAAAVELVPRITRAQSMDALSSQASVGGYKAAILAADTLAQYFPLLMTAAGTVSPARVVVMGGGVAGLQAVATARRLGAVVEVSDVREAVREQVESLGGRFIDLPPTDDSGGDSGEATGGYAREMTPEFLAEQRRIVAERIAAANVVICTAQVPGKRAPLLVTQQMVESMRPGSVIVDLTAAQGGNCELTQPDETVVHDGVTILGPTNLASELARDASRLYARNLEDLLMHLTGGDSDRPFELDLADEITSQVLVTHGGEVRNRDVILAIDADGGEEE